MLSFSYIWPIALAVLSNIVYQVCSKSVPSNLNPFASLSVTYIVGAIASLVAFLVLGNHTDFVQELRKINWAPLALGIVIVGLEMGAIYTYRAGWEISVATVVQSSFIAVGLLLVGRALFGETITITKLAGVAICMVGLWFINR